MFKKIYVERQVLENERTKRILAKYSNAEIIICEHYGELFNIKNQSFRLKKSDQALIIAKKQGKKILPAPEGFGIGGKENYYFSHMLNCLYDCRYCFLQGMYNSAYYVWFVNYEDFFNEIIEISKDGKERYFFSGYDCDSLALENISFFASEFIPLFQNLGNSYLEFRTKSVNVKVFDKFEPLKNVIIAFSFTPEELSKNIEYKVPPVKSRISVLNKLAARGWKVGIRLDPMIYTDNFNEIYGELIENLFSNLKIDNLHSVSVGQMRFPKKMYERIYDLYPKEKILNDNLKNRGKLVSYDVDVENKMEDFVMSKLAGYISQDIIFSCK